MTINRLLILFVAIGISCGHERTQKDLLTHKKWQIKKVEYLVLGRTAPEGVGDDMVFTFNENETFTFESENYLGDQITAGTWVLHADSLILTQDTITTFLKIEALTDNSLIWTMPAVEDTLRMTLISSNAGKKVEH